MVSNATSQTSEAPYSTAHTAINLDLLLEDGRQRTESTFHELQYVVVPLQLCGCLSYAKMSYETSLLARIPLEL